jgi:site-specific DNA-methyltransferase (adenine-specific)/modification methylase
MVNPYYQRGETTIYCGDCREILPGLLGIDSIVTDPPYGINLKTEYGKRGGANPMEKTKMPRIIGDDKPFDPSHLLGYQKVILWGAENYTDKIPPNKCWLLWDKRCGVIPDRTQGDCEMAWTNLEGVNRIFRHVWDGMVKDSERGKSRTHPAQKPVALMSWCIQ